MGRIYRLHPETGKTILLEEFKRIKAQKKEVQKPDPETRIRELLEEDDYHAMGSFLKGMTDDPVPGPKDERREVLEAMLEG